MNLCEIIWRDSVGGVRKKTFRWNGASTNTDLADYMENYLWMVAEGYQPYGFISAPVPHCARITCGGKPVAEWYQRPKRSAESLVTAEPLGPEGIPVAVTPTPSSGVGLSGGPASYGNHSAEAAIPQSQCAVNNASLTGDFGVDQGGTVA